MTLFVYELSHFLNEFLFSSFCVSVVFINNITISVNDQCVRNHLNSKCTLEIAVRVKQYFIRPLMTVNKRFYLVDVLCLVNRNGYHLYAGLFLPLFINFADGSQLTVARLAPCGKEINDERFAIV